jgi:hypothetical protein
MVSGALDVALTFGLYLVSSIAVARVVYPSLDRLGVPNHYLRSGLTTVVALSGGLFIGGVLLTALNTVLV